MKILFLLLIISIKLYGQHSVKIAETDVLRYDCSIEPDIARKTIKGSVAIIFKILNAGTTLSFDRGDLAIESVKMKGKDIVFNVKGNKLLIEIGDPLKVESTYEIDISYHGSPTRGINFFPELEQVYTVFSTSQWLICKDNPDDKATLSMKITCPSNLKVVGCGELIKTTPLTNGKSLFEWNQSKAFPTYTFGFAVGPYNEYKDSNGNLDLRYLSSGYSSEQLNTIFSETKSMIQFFEERSGISFPGKSYTQVLGEGTVSQEMAGFTVIRLNYGKQVLDNASDINLAAHELAHQWWGNGVTCLNWNHFWLNEGFAVFMSSAFKESRFGKDVYLKDISVYKEAYEAVVKKGLDKPLVFPNWNNPTSDDRTLVYYKGAYCLHLLREQLGEEAFWKGVKEYTSAYFGKCVTSADLRGTIEKVSGQNLGVFFAKWIEEER